MLKAQLAASSLWESFVQLCLSFRLRLSVIFQEKISFTRAEKTVSLFYTDFQGKKIANVELTQNTCCVFGWILFIHQIFIGHFQI